MIVILFGGRHDGMSIPIVGPPPSGDEYIDVPDLLGDTTRYSRPQPYEYIFDRPVSIALFAEEIDLQELLA